jgi:hypothetical protein
MDKPLSSSFAKIIEQRLPNNFLPEHATDEKVLMIIDAWVGMKDKIVFQEEQIFVIMKDLEYSLNLLNIAETHVDNIELKKIINDMLDFYRSKFPLKEE